MEGKVKEAITCRSSKLFCKNWFGRCRKMRDGINESERGSHLTSTKVALSLRTTKC